MASPPLSPRTGVEVTGNSFSFDGREQRGDYDVKRKMAICDGHQNRSLTDDEGTVSHARSDHHHYDVPKMQPL